MDNMTNTHTSLSQPYIQLTHMSSHTGLNQTPRPMWLIGILRFTDRGVRVNLALCCVMTLLISRDKTTCWMMCLSTGQDMFVHLHHPASSSLNIKSHLVDACLRLFMLRLCVCLCVCARSGWLLCAQVPSALLAVTSGRGVAYIICYEAWTSVSNYGKTQGTNYSHNSFSPLS